MNYKSYSLNYQDKYCIHFHVFNHIQNLHKIYIESKQYEISVKISNIFYIGISSKFLQTENISALGNWRKFYSRECKRDAFILIQKRRYFQYLVSRKTREICRFTTKSDDSSGAYGAIIEP